MTEQDKARMVEALTLALTSGMTGQHEWVTLHDIKLCLSNAKIAMDRSQLKEWLDHLIGQNIVEASTDTGTRKHVLYRLVGDNTPEQAPDDERPPHQRPKWNILERQKDAATIAELTRKNAELEKQLMASNKQSRERKEAKYQAERAVQVYGEVTELAQVKERVALHPTFSNLPANGQALVAQVAHVMGLNPFMHIHAWVDKKGKLNITPDYKGLLFLAGEDNIMIDDERSRILTRDELKARGVSDVNIENGAVGAVCYVIDMNKAARCKELGLDYHPVSGYAVWYPKQTKTGKSGPYDVYNEPPNGRDGAWVAEKNALRAALYKVSDLSLKLGGQVEGVEISDDGWQAELPHDDNVIDGDFTVAGDHWWDDKNQRQRFWIAATPLSSKKSEVAFSIGFTIDDDAAENSDNWREYMQRYPDLASAIAHVTNAIHEMKERIAENAAPEVVEDDAEPVAINGITGEVIDPAEEADAPGKCANCSEPATGAGPYPNLCAEHAKNAADFHAESNS
jgi:hypothetical protein